MSSPLYYPGAALPPSAMYPYNAQLPVNTKTRWSSTCTGPNSYSFRTNRCSSLAGAFCANSYGDPFVGPDGVPQYNGFASDPQQFVISGGPCYPIKGCLDAKALTYDKNATQHCQGMCVYRKPKICVAEDVREYYGAEPACPRDADGRTAVERMYDSAPGSKERVGSYYGMYGVFDRDC